jgi:hypothetical protein
MLVDAQGRPLSDLHQALQLHLSKLGKEPPLLSIVEAPDVQRLLSAFRQADSTALKEQKSYRRYGRLALWTTMAATVIGAVALLPIGDGIHGWAKIAVQVAQALALTLSFIATVWVSWRQSISQWLRARATAEGLRGEVFRAILGDGAAKGLLMPALACFEDAHLDWQLGYYTKAAKRYRRSAGNAAPYKVVGYLVLTVAVLTGLVGLLNTAAQFDWSWPTIRTAAQWMPLAESGRWQLGLGAMATAILAFASARSFMDQDDRQAVLCEMARKRLEEIKRQGLAAAETAAASGDAATVMKFCGDVQSIMSAEHLAWMYPSPLDEASVPKRML